MCKDGSCASHAGACSGDLMGDCDTGVSGVKSDAHDYDGCNALDFVSGTSIDTAPDWRQVPGDGQYRGEQNCDAPPAAQQELGITCLPPGRTDNYVTSDGSLRYHTFGLNQPLKDILDEGPSTSVTQTSGCGMGTDPRSNTEALFMVSTPIPLQCTVPSGRSGSS
jgi:hypothetical protein